MHIHFHPSYTLKSEIINRTNYGQEAFILALLCSGNSPALRVMLLRTIKLSD